MKLIKKIIISGELEVLTGLHIGGSSTSMNIGEVDLSVIKSPQDGMPIIPGSSLKGKLRSLLAKLEGSKSIEEDSEDICNIFGWPEKRKTKEKDTYITRIIVRDSFLSKPKEISKWEKEGKFTEIKWENTIDRVNSSANPRQLERVPKGAKFRYEMILDVYEGEEGKYKPLIEKAMNLLEDDYLGGSGSRGYGKIKFHRKDDQTKTVENYGQQTSD
jgi:CRISPR-associated protein Csm3